MVDQQELDMRLHSDAINQLLLLLHYRVFGVALDPLTLGHLDPLSRLLDGVSRKL